MLSLFYTILFRHLLNFDQPEINKVFTCPEFLIIDNKKTA